MSCFPYLFIRINYVLGPFSLCICMAQHNALLGGAISKQTLMGAKSHTAELELVTQAEHQPKHGSLCHIALICSCSLVTILFLCDSRTIFFPWQQPQIQNSFFHFQRGIEIFLCMLSCGPSKHYAFPWHNDLSYI